MCLSSKSLTLQLIGNINFFDVRRIYILSEILSTEKHVFFSKKIFENQVPKTEYLRFWNKNFRKSSLNIVLLYTKKLK